MAEADFHILSFINTELSHNAMLGHFQSPPFIPMMTRPKKNSTKKRIIIDLSFPHGKSVNTGIVKGYYLGLPFNFSLPSVATLTD